MAGAMVRLRDSVFFCPSCSAENFYDQDSMRDSGGAQPKCWECKKPITLPVRIRLGRSVIMLNYNTHLYVEDHADR